jgi:hypothetical protein
VCPLILDACEEPPELLGAPHPPTSLLWSRWVGERRHVAAQETPADGGAESAMEGEVDLPDAPRGQPLAVRSPVLEKVGVQLVQAGRGDLLQRQVADARGDVVPHRSFVAGVGERPHAPFDSWQPLAAEILAECQPGRLDVGPALDLREQGTEGRLGLAPRREPGVPFLPPLAVLAADIDHDSPPAAALPDVASHRLPAFGSSRPRLRAALIHRDAVDTSTCCALASALTGYLSPSATSDP